MTLPALVGVPAHFSRQEWARAPLDPQVGGYAGGTRVIGIAPAPCPLCGGTMHEWLQTSAQLPFGRIVAITRRDPDGWPREGVLELIPPSLRIFGCPACHQIFTQLPAVEYTAGSSAPSSLDGC